MPLNSDLIGSKYPKEKECYISELKFIEGYLLPNFYPFAEGAKEFRQ